VYTAILLKSSGKKLHSGDILIAVPLPILTNSSGKIAEFNYGIILREKHAKTVELI
jgi:hypothetical protein